ncbi:hypothetical protein [Bifidobacterium asteroides]|uniref:Uncharacterized protein n=2 Tax=Bifidobacterium asteroides TaxID=1684 RepID=A0A2N3R915_9BIFI|nr:hypothetical protein [Bifidobacterium asteroides]PKV08457.1 hypothetical protein CQR44_1414 [Bifidobacterium asteroides]
MQLFSVDAQVEINVPPIDQPYTKPSLAIDFMTENKEAKKVITNESPLYDSGMCDVAWRINGPAKNKTCFVLFPGKDNTIRSATSHNPDTPKTSYFISQSLPQLDTIAVSRVHLFSYYVCPKNRHIYWLYRGIYTLVKEFKSTLPINQGTSSLNGTKLSTSGSIPVYLSLWSRAIE